MANFDFKAYNEVIKGSGAGLKLMLIEQLLEDVEKTCRRFNNPLKNDVSEILDEVYNLRDQWKKNAEKATRISAAAASADAAAHHQEVTTPAS